MQKPTNNIADIPQPFRDFLVQGQIGAMAVKPPDAPTRRDDADDYGDLLFLAAILMLCDD
jgi:hypothetical protein